MLIMLNSNPGTNQYLLQWGWLFLLNETMGGFDGVHIWWVYIIHEGQRVTSEAIRQ